MIPNVLHDWTIDVLNETIVLRDIESETFDFKGTEIKDLAKHICAFANTHGGFLVLGIEEITNGDIKTGFQKNGFKLGKEDQIKNEIRNQQVQLDPIPGMDVKIIPDAEQFFVVIHVQNNNFKKPFFVKNKNLCFVRIGPSTNTASRNTILELFSDTKTIIQNLENFRASVVILKESLIQTLEIFASISSNPPNRVPQLDLSLVRANVVKCESFLREHDLLGETTHNSVYPGMTTILHTLDTLNSYIDGFSNSVDEDIKHDLQSQVLKQGFTLYYNLEKVNPFLDELLSRIEAYLKKIQY